MTENVPAGNSDTQTADSTAENTSTTATFTAAVGEGEHVIQQGESIVSIAKQTGHYWKTIWEHPENSALRESRNNPNVLLPGDRVHIPEIETKNMDSATDQTHRFRRRGEPAILKIVFQDRGQPRANESYVATIEGRHFSGTLDAEGRMTLSLPSNSRNGRVIVGEGDTAAEYNLQIHQLNPADHQTGLQQRLKNLGYPCDVSGDIDQQTRSALGEYRKRHQQSVSEHCDDAIKDQIKQEHRDA